MRLTEERRFTCVGSRSRPIAGCPTRPRRRRVVSQPGLPTQCAATVSKARLEALLHNTVHVTLLVQMIARQNRDVQMNHRHFPTCLKKAAIQLFSTSQQVSCPRDDAVNQDLRLSEPISSLERRMCQYRHTHGILRPVIALLFSHHAVVEVPSVGLERVVQRSTDSAAVSRFNFPQTCRPCTYVDAPCDKVFHGPSSVNLTEPSSLKQSYALRRAIFFSNDQCFCSGVSIPPG